MRVLRRRGNPTDNDQPSGRPVFDGLVVKVDCPTDKASTKAVLASKLEGGGARYAQRLRKDLTHVVFVKQGDADEDVKRMKRIEEFGIQRGKNGGAGLLVVSPLWVEQCLHLNSRVDEANFRPLEDNSIKRGRKYVTPPPPPLSLEPGLDSQRKKRKSRTPKGGIVPKPLDHFDVDHSNLDSSRKLKECQNYGENVVSPAGETTQDVARVMAKQLCNALEIPDSAIAGDDLDTPLSQRCSRRLSANVSKHETTKESNDEHTKKENENNRKRKKKESGPSQRFSLRRLFVYPERQVLLDKNLPEGPVEAKPVLKKTVGSGVPIPEVERVSSPWGTPREVGKVHGIDFSTVSKAKKSQGTPFTKKRVPSPWSTLRPWDIMKKNRKSLLSQQASQPSQFSQIQEVSASGIMPGNSDGTPATHTSQGKYVSNSTETPHTTAANLSPPSTRLSQEMLTLPTPSQLTSIQGSQSCGREISGMLAVTSVPTSILDLCKTAVDKLSGLTLWANKSRKSGRISHLIIGDNRRTLKAMLAVLHGAYLLRPEYVTASLEAGYWLPEDNFLADVIFQQGSIKARQTKCAIEAGENLPNLLQGKKVSIYTQGRRAGDESYQVVRKICQELGATLFHISDADICIMMDDEASVRPTGIPTDAVAVKKEWLFQSACAYSMLDMEEFSVHELA